MTRAEGGYATIYGGVFLALGAQMAILPLWLSDRGLTDAEIGWISAAALGVRIFVGLGAPALADRLDARNAMLRWLAVLGVAASLAHAAAPQGGSLLVFTALSLALAVVFAGVLPIAEAEGYASATREGWPYRRARSVGSAAFVAATLFVGAAADAFGPVATPLALALGFGAVLLGAVGAAGGRPIRVKEPPPDAGRGAAAFFRDPRTWLAFIAAGAVQASHAVFYAFGSLHLEALGWSQTAIGAFWALGVAAEIVFFLAAGAWAARASPALCLALAAAAAVARWALMTTDPELAGLVLGQCLHALTFGLTHLAALAFIAARSPRSAAATAQGVLATLSGGVLMLPATAAAAWIFPAEGGGAYWIGAAAAALGLAAATGLGALEHNRAQRRALRSDRRREDG